jgi:hypothetical protein
MRARAFAPPKIPSRRWVVPRPSVFVAQDDGSAVLIGHFRTFVLILTIKVLTAQNGRSTLFSTGVLDVRVPRTRDLPVPPHG